MIRRLRVKLQQSALDDLRKIANYIAKASGSKKIARGFAKRIKDRCLRIGDAPRAGRFRDDLIPGLRTVPFERSAVICYLVEADGIFVVNIFYGGQDFEAILRGERLEPEED